MMPIPQPLPIPQPVPIPAPNPPPVTDPGTGFTVPSLTVPLQPPPSPPPSTKSTPGAVPPMPDWVQFLVWLGALVVLWLILTALAEAGFEREAYGMAGLLTFGALFFMGPTAIKNAQTLINTTGQPST